MISEPENKTAPLSLSQLIKPKKWIVQYAVIGLLSFVLGLVCAESLVPSASRFNAAIVDRVGFLSSQRDERLRSEFEAINWREELPQVPTMLEQGMQTNAALRAHAVQRFLQATNTTEQFQLLNLISTAPTPDLEIKAAQWAGDANSAKARQSGFALLSRLRPSDATKPLILNALFNEQDATVLEWVVRGLARPSMPEPQLSKTVVARLHVLTQHKSANVRAASIQRLAEWDKAMREFPGDVMRLLADENSEVRTAAIGAVSIAGLRIPSVKQRLVQILADAKENDLVRSVAYMNLPDFDLNEEEYAAYQGYNSEIEKDSAAAKKDSKK